ncbi:MAG TPA: non-heme iron oxygenase ferredoxin subunit [Steroidobacteraceae bacterium]|jgi:nitrite reductase/ring-hydroxylating ferredoxin subunit|nr:non-heme iron oxygenase ferredoxin subunit [Steroidobacteraceae bacterium]
MTQWYDVGPIDIIGENEVAAVVAGGRPLAIFLVDGVFHALHDLCTHGQARLSDGFVEDGCVECPLHQGTFDIASGEPRCAPATERVPNFPVRVSGGRIEVAL